MQMQSVLQCIKKVYAVFIQLLLCQSPLETASVRPTETTNLGPAEKSNYCPVEMTIASRLQQNIFLFCLITIYNRLKLCQWGIFAGVALAIDQIEGCGKQMLLQLHQIQLYEWLSLVIFNWLFLPDSEWSISPDSNNFFLSFFTMSNL